MEVAGELGLAEAFPVLDAIFRDEADDYRGSAAMGLGSGKQEKYLPELSRLLIDEKQGADLRGDVAWALQLMGSEAALQALREAEAKVADADVREDVRRALEERAAR